MKRCLPLAAAVLLLSPQIARAVSPADVLGQEVELALSDAILLALEHNLNLAVARTDPAVANQAVRQATGAYDPTLFADFNFANDEDPSANAIQSALLNFDRTIKTQSWTYDAGVTGILPYGMSYSSTLDLNQIESSSAFFTLDPEYRTAWTSQLTLPLLKNFLRNQADVTVERSRINQAISDQDFRRLLIDEVLLVESTYWDLTAALEQHRVAMKSLETAQSLLEQTRVQYEVGVIARVDITQAQSGLAEREESEISARFRGLNVQDRLLSQILAPGATDYEGTVIKPESPAMVQYEVDIDAAVKRAFATRPELYVARGRVADAEVELGFAENQTLPQFDVTGSYTLQGLAGKVDTPPQPDSIKSEARNAFHDLGNREKSYSLGAQFSVPFPNTSARALATQRRIEYRRARTELRREEQRIILETRLAARALLAAIERIEASERRQEASDEALRAEQERLRLGDSTPFDVLQREEDVVEAEDGLITALQVYRVAISELERAQGTLLERRGIQVRVELERR